MNFKRIIAIMLAATFVFALAGCADTGDGDDNGDALGNDKYEEKIYTDSESAKYEYTYDENIDGY